MEILDDVPMQEFEKTRNKWGFNALKAGGAAVVRDAKNWLPAQRAAHDYARRQSPKWEIECKWYDNKKLGIIRRYR